MYQVISVLLFLTIYLSFWSLGILKIMKISKEIISLPLSQLINDSISKGSFPNICKLAQVIPISKNDSRLLCTNYRPISLLSNIGKIFEKVIHSRLNFSLEQHNHLYPYQFCFWKDYSTNNALMTLVQIIHSSLMLETILLEYLLTLKAHSKVW